MSSSAVLDLGTNTFRLLIFRQDNTQGLTRLRIERRISRMGEGVADTGRICPAALERGRAVLQEYGEILRREGVVRVRAVATGVFRVAENVEEVLRGLSHALVHPIRVISGEEEGAYTLTGVRGGLDLSDRSECLVFDVGGGSTELVRMGGGGDDRIRSLPVGALSLKEQYGKRDPLNRKNYAIMREAIRRSLDRVDSFFLPSPHFHAVGTGGSVTTLASMLRGLHSYHAEKVHRMVLRARQVASLLQTALPLTVAELRDRYTLEPGKADLILFGGTLLLEILLRIPGQRITVSDYGLLEGVALELG